MKYPGCKSGKVVKNGRIHNGKQNYRCRSCGRQFVLHLTKKVIGNETKAQIDGLLLVRLPLAGVARVEGVSEKWLQSYVNQKYQQVEQRVNSVEKKGALTIECDKGAIGLWHSLPECYLTTET